MKLTAIKMQQKKVNKNTFKLKIREKRIENYGTERKKHVRYSKTIQRTCNLNFISEEKESKAEVLPKEIMANHQPIETQELREPQPD